MTPAELLGTQAVTAAITAGTVQALKYALPNAPKVATVGIAFVAAEAWSAAAALFVLHSDLAVGLMIGIVVWLGSMGLWSGASTVLSNDTRPQGKGAV